VEVANAVEFLTGRFRDPRLEEVTLALAAEMLVSAGLAGSNGEGLRLARQSLESGAAADRFARMVHGLGGPANFVERYQDHLPAAPVERVVPAPRPGFVTAIATRDIGLAVVGLGGGRTRPDDAVDPSVGFTRLLPIGAEVARGDALAIVHARNETTADSAVAAIQSAYAFGDSKPQKRGAVVRRIGPRG
jgi:thymidine phosphorylase